MGANEEFGMWNAEWKRFSQRKKNRRRSSRGGAKGRESGIRNAEGKKFSLSARRATEDHGGEIEEEAHAEDAEIAEGREGGIRN